MAKTMVVTGGSCGIGRECARFFAQKGYDIIFNYNIHEEEAVSLNKEFPNCFPVRADFNKKGQTENFCNIVKERFSHLDVLINNAGIADYSLITDLENERWDEIMNVNLKAMYITSRELLPLMIREHKGAVVNISSMWGITGASCEVAYSASKGGVIAFTKALAKEVGPSGISVNAIAPGVINTNMTKCLDEAIIKELAEEVPLLKIGEPSDIAETAYFLSQSKFITGQVLAVDGGMTI